MPPGSSGSNTSSPWKRPVNANSAESRLPILSPYDLPDGLAGSILPLPGPTATLQPLSKPLPGAISAFLSLWRFPASLSGAKSAFSIPNSPSAPRFRAISGSNHGFLSQNASSRWPRRINIGFYNPAAHMAQLKQFIYAVHKMHIAETFTLQRNV